MVDEIIVRAASRRLGAGGLWAGAHHPLGDLALGPQHAQRHHDRDEHQRSSDEEREVVAPGQRRRGGVAALTQAAGLGAGERRQDREAEGSPTCTVVLTRPEASPASVGVAPDIASVISDGNDTAMPVPSRIITGSTSVR